MKRCYTIALAVGLCLSISACRELENDAATVADAKGTITPASTFGSGPEQVWVDKAKDNFRHGEYGLAERYFRQAVEERNENIEAWLGLAASYDHLKRFDEADRAYAVIKKMAGETPIILNNLGYHYMLKGDFASAERALQTAQSRDPDNPLIRANLALLADWRVTAGRG